MKKALSIISSAVLTLAVTTPTTVDAQMAKKASAAPARVSVTQKAAAKPTAGKKVHKATTRKARTANGFQAAAYGTTLKNAGAPRKVLAAEANLPTIYGSVTYNDTWTQNNQPVGLYDVSQSTTSLLIEGVDASYGGVCVDGIYYATQYLDYGFIAFPIVEAYDVETGEVVGSTYPDVDALAPGGVTLDPTTGNVYGITYNETGEAYQLSKLEYTLGEGSLSVTVTPVAPISGSWNSLVCDKDGQLYGISYTFSGETATASYLNKIDKTTGTVTQIGQTGQLPQYLSSATIDAKTNRMFWCVNPPDETGLLCEVNLTTGHATVLMQYENNDEVMGMYVPYMAEGGAPASVTALEASFPEGSMSGIISFAAPTTLFDGTAATGDITYTILANGEQIATGTTTYGATVNAPVTLATPGEYTFTVTVSNAVGESPKAKVTTFIGKGTPAAPVATLTYDNGTFTLNWAAVTESADGGYINPAAVTYNVTRYPGATAVATGLTTTSFTEDITEPTTLTEYYYEVVAVADGVSSAVGKSNIVSLGNIEPPYTNSFDTADALAGYTIIDANNDGKSWSVSGGAVRVSYNSSKAMDDWMITPAVRLEAGKAYYVSFKAYSQSNNYSERVEAKWGTAPTAAGMTNDLVAPTDLTVTSEEALVLGDYITPTADGLYYVGIHGISDADKYYLFVDDLSIGSAMAATAPGVATDIVITPDPAGALKASVAFKAPAVDFAGNALSSLTKVEVSRQGEVIKTFDNPAVGAALSFDDVLLEGGDVEYTFQGFNADGAGKTVTATAFIGFGAPEAPANVTMVETSTPGEVTITWDAVTEDVNGLPLSAADVQYVVTDEEGYPVSDMLNTTTVTIQACGAGEQTFAQYAVFAITNGGEDYTFTDMIAVGTPYAGINESFADGTLSYIWGMYAPDPSNAGSVELVTDEDLGIAAADGDNGFVAIYGDYLDTSEALFTGKVDLTGMANPGISFYTYNLGAEDINEIQLAVKEPTDTEWTALGAPIVVNQTGDEGWNMVTASLSAYAGKTVQVSFQATVKQYKYTMFDNIKIGSLAAQDLAASAISAPAKVTAGEIFNVTVTVANEGMQASTADAAVELYEGTTLLDTKALEAIASGAKATVSFERTMSAVAEHPSDFYAKVVYAADENPDNNTTETVSVAPRYSSLPKVTDLEGTNTADGVKLTWSEPDLSNVGEAKVVDFEDGENGSFEYDDWTFVDEDNSPVGGFQGTDVPGITPNATTASFFVFDADAIAPGNPTFEAHSGNIYIAALFRYDDGQTSDWAISPELDGSAQTITFWAKSYSSEYPEDIEMLYSSTSTATADFVKVTEKKGLSKDWTEYTFDVPEGAKYFAIRSCAQGSFMLMLDDFEFNAASNSANLSIVGYDVYRDGEKITTEPTGETEYTDVDAEDGTHSYVVVTVYTTGTSAPSNAVTVEVTGLKDVIGGQLAVKAGKGTITVTGAEIVTVAAADGKVLYNGAANGQLTVSVPAGVYVVKADQTVVKVAVK